jgi:hypothetical protein
MANHLVFLPFSKEVVHAFSKVSSNTALVGGVRLPACRNRLPARKAIKSKRRRRCQLEAGDRCYRRHDLTEKLTASGAKSTRVFAVGKES